MLARQVRKPKRPQRLPTLKKPVASKVESRASACSGPALLASFSCASLNTPPSPYPVHALREALVNAVAHRNYEDASRKTTVQVFSDRIVVASPGYPPAPLTLAKLRKGNYRACSRNPVIAQALATLKLMEQRGSGFARMHDAMLNHGLDAPTFAEQDGYFVVTFPGPNGNYDRIKTPETATGLVSPAVEAQLNDRQKKIMVHVIGTGSVTNRWCRSHFHIVYNTAYRDLQGLVALDLLKPLGSGRSVKYVLKKAHA